MTDISLIAVQEPIKLGFNKKLDKLKTELQTKNLNHINIESCIMYKIKRDYVEFMIDGCYNYAIDFRPDLLTGDSDFRKYNFSWEGKCSDISTSYWEFILSLLENLKTHNPVAVHIVGRTAEIGRYGINIIRKVFKENLHIEYDTNYHSMPYGIALYERHLRSIN